MGSVRIFDWQFDLGSTFHHGISCFLKSSKYILQMVKLLGGKYSLLFLNEMNHLLGVIILIVPVI